jgi:hypothetical protein
MKHLQDDVAKVISAVVLQKPIIEPTISYNGDYIFFKCNKTVNIHMNAVMAINGSVVEIIRNHIDLNLDIEKNEYEIRVNRDSLYDRINYHMTKVALSFIAEKGGHSNNKLTSLYKWYRDAVQSNSFLRNQAFMSDLYEFNKFLNSKTQNEDHLKVCRSVLLLIKNRYESLETFKRKTTR